MNRTVIFTMGIVLVLGMAVAAVAEKAPHDYPGKVAFASNRSGDWEIYVMPADRTSIIRVTTNPADDIMPCFNPANPRELVFVSNREGQNELYLVDYMVKEVTRLTNTTWDELWPFYSPDGKKLLYRANPDGNFHIYEMDLATKKTKQLTDSAGDESTPCYSYDMQNISYCSNESGKWAIYCAKVDGTGARMFLNSEYDSSHPRYSPDDQLYVYQSMLGKDRKNLEIFTMDVGGKQSKQLTKDNYIDFNPTWCPTGEYIAFVSNRDKDHLNIYFMDRDGKNIWNFTQSTKDTPEGDNDYPTWVTMVLK
jgi:Tol biopolymer transport system component